jgi:deazaflavin-dependent oxidoreductase (nitroreductase family)
MQRSLTKRMDELILKLLLPLLIFLYRVTGGRIAGSMNGTAVLLLTTTGRKSGEQRTVPLSYIKDASSYVIAATNGGRDSQPGWFLNVHVHSQVTLQVKNQIVKAEVELAGPEQRRELWARFVQGAPQVYEGLQARTSRAFPIVIFHPLDGRSVTNLRSER